MFDTKDTVTEAHPEPAIPVLTLSYDYSINYAFQKNAIPVVNELHFKNDAIARKDLVIRVSTELAFAVQVDKGSMPRANSGGLKADVIDGENVVYSITEPISLLARNEWCGLVALPEILAALILPNDPARSSLVAF